MKKHLSIMSIILTLFLFVGCSGQYKRISFVGESLGQEETLVKIQGAKLVYSAKETFPETMPIYSITPREISQESFRELAKAFGVEEEPTAVDPIAQLWYFDLDSTTGNYTIKPASNTTVTLTSYGSSNGSANGRTPTSAGNVFVATDIGSLNQFWELVPTT